MMFIYADHAVVMYGQVFMYDFLWTVVTMFFHAAAMVSITGDLLCRIMYYAGFVIHIFWDQQDFCLFCWSGDVYHIAGILLIQWILWFILAECIYGSPIPTYLLCAYKLSLGMLMVFI